jgi:hypothetical protein
MIRDVLETAVRTGRIDRALERWRARLEEKAKACGCVLDVCPVCDGFNSDSCDCGNGVVFRKVAQQIPARKIRATLRAKNPVCSYGSNSATSARQGCPHLSSCEARQSKVTRPKLKRGFFCRCSGAGCGRCQM